MSLQPLLSRTSTVLQWGLQFSLHAPGVQVKLRRLCVSLWRRRKLSTQRCTQRAGTAQRLYVWGYDVWSFLNLCFLEVHHFSNQTHLKIKISLSAEDKTHHPKKKNPEWFLTPCLTVKRAIFLFGGGGSYEGEVEADVVLSLCLLIKTADEVKAVKVLTRKNVLIKVPWSYSWLSV